MDSDIRDLERVVDCAPDDVNGYSRLAFARGRAGDVVGAVRAYDRVLALSPSSDLAGIAEQNIVDLNVPVVIFADNELICHNVPHQGVADTSRVPYLFKWDLALLSKSARSTSVDFFTQDEANARLKSLKSDKLVPTPREYHSTIRFLADAQLRNVQSVEVARAQQLFRSDFEKYWMLTSGRIEGSSVLQGYGRPSEAQERIQTDIRGNNDYLRELGPAGSTVAQVVLGAGESVEQLDLLYNAASGATRGTRVWTRENTDVHPRPVLLGRSSVIDGNAFIVDCYDGIYYCGPVRLAWLRRSRKNSP